MIPRTTVAAALGLPADTDALPPGDLPARRFAERLIGYLAGGDRASDAPDAWTGAVMDRLIAEDPALALDVLMAGARLDGAKVLADPLADLAQAGHADAVAARALDDPALATLVDDANAV